MPSSASIPPSMSSPRGDERRDEVLRVAIDVFGESGFAGGRIDEVARRVGIRRPSVLYHFPDKSTLYRAALARVVEEITRLVVETEVAAAPADQRLQSIVDAWIDFVIDRQWAARLMLRQMIDETPGAAPDEAIGPVATLLASLQRALDEQVGPSASARIEASEFALILSSTTLVWVASSRAVEDALGLRTLEPEAIERHRATLRSLVGQLVAAARSAEPSAGRSGSNRSSAAESGIAAGSPTEHPEPRSLR